VQRAVHGLSFEEHDKRVAEEHARKYGTQGNGNGEDDLGVGDEPEAPELLMLDPKEWKVRVDRITSPQ
jgi:DnaJ family protein C protein 2